jgi:hypothetical protein
MSKDVVMLTRLVLPEQIPLNRTVMRGLGGTVLESRWFVRDERGVRGGVELGFLSTTTNKNIALEYSGADKNRGTVFEIDVGAIDCGAKLDCFSQYPGKESVMVDCILQVSSSGNCMQFLTCRGRGDSIWAAFVLGSSRRAKFRIS